MNRWDQLDQKKKTRETREICQNQDSRLQQRRLELSNDVIVSKVSYHNFFRLD